ncbi:hypothetical protein CHLNCDRAFT_145348 [Chlorella variabilis]|uniref:MLO-like protein n=1 Tax=Chlorella variabilis TaxID=554065 RepID=E1ZE83_CHLVA|nr:hypothetical protein CHLNCDRAFT_145348 [Chlorella variabilis]EFN55984.1 hypothetical protein CHLNCDRAFT_145348 [Chlorella variabilis]|eukprot:XP_005848086.1 hypothetical protein CHLNCDRAFT_145348 [Chlorella variabilis]
MSELPGWRIGIIFIIFFTVAFAWDAGTAALEGWLKRHHKRGLRHVLQRLQRELLVLGLLSLLLIAFEGYLLKICIPCGTSCSWDCPAQQGSDAGSGSDGGHRRQLLASAALDELSCRQAADTCGPGSEPFWSQLALIQAHVFLFTIAAVHICYACVSMLLCLWKLRRWHRFEQHALQHELRPMSLRSLPRPGDNALTHFLWCIASMLTGGVNAEVYLGLRRLFVERLDVDPSFDFWSFLVESMEEEFSQVVGVNIVLWLLLLVWIMLPGASYQMIWLSSLAVAAVFLVGIKLQSIIICLAQGAYQLYGSRSADESAPAQQEAQRPQLDAWPQVPQRERQQQLERQYRGPDAASLFWFGKPRLVLRTIQLVYFENSLSIAAVLFSVWQGVDFDWSRYGGWPFLVSMIVIEHALKKNIKPDMARQVGMLALQRMSAEPRWSPEPGEHVPDSTGNAEQLAEAADAGVYDVSTRPAGASSMQQLEQEGGSELSGQQPDRGSSQAGVGLAAFAAGGSAAVLDISDADDERLSITRLMESG